MRTLVLILVALTLGTTSPVRAQNADALRQAGAFAVQIAWDDDVDAHRLGIDTAVMRTKAELVIRQAGLPVIPVAQGDTLPDALFRVYVSALQLETDAAEPEKLRTFAYLLTAKYVEWLTIRGQNMFADVWTCSRFGVTEEAEFLYATATQCVEEFANQWLEGNPRR
ncbi:MAG: hypothetical protein OEY20_12275 [Gemmatimonadota bacterium]|nr:hypothetical protein [Gemmatimonadota bacterium]